MNIGEHLNAQYSIIYKKESSQFSVAKEDKMNCHHCQYLIRIFPSFKLFVHLFIKWFISCTYLMQFYHKSYNVCIYEIVMDFRYIYII